MRIVVVFIVFIVFIVFSGVKLLKLINSRGVRFPFMGCKVPVYGV